MDGFNDGSGTSNGKSHGFGGTPMTEENHGKPPYGTDQVTAPMQDYLGGKMT